MFSPTFQNSCRYSVEGERNLERERESVIVGMEEEKGNKDELERERDMEEINLCKSIFSLYIIYFQNFWSELSLLYCINFVKILV